MDGGDCSILFGDCCCSIGCWGDCIICCCGDCCIIAWGDWSIDWGECICICCWDGDCCIICCCWEWEGDWSGWRSIG